MESSGGPIRRSLHSDNFSLRPPRICEALILGRTSRHFEGTQNGADPLFGASGGDVSDSAAVVSAVGSVPDGAMSVVVTAGNSFGGPGAVEAHLGPGAAESTAAMGSSGTVVLALESSLFSPGSSPAVSDLRGDEPRASSSRWRPSSSLHLSSWMLPSVPIGRQSTGRYGSSSPGLAAWRAQRTGVGRGRYGLLPGWRCRRLACGRPGPAPRPPAVSPVAHCGIVRESASRPISGRTLAAGVAMTIQPLDSLLEKLCSGDPAAAEQVFLAFEPYLRMVVRKKLPGRLRAKFDSMDVVQSVWADVLRGFREAGWRFADEAHLRAFLVKLTRHRFIDHLRRHRTAVARERPLGELPRENEPLSGSPAPASTCKPRSCSSGCWRCAPPRIGR